MNLIVLIALIFAGVMCWRIVDAEIDLAQAHIACQQVQP